MALRSNLISTCYQSNSFRTKNKKGGMRGPANARADPHNKGAAMGGLQFYLRTPLPTLRHQEKGRHWEGCGQADPRRKKGAAGGGCGFACEPPCCAQNKKHKNKKKERKTKKRENLTTKVPGQLLTLEEHAWRPFGYDQGRLGCLRCLSCSCLVGLVCSVCAGVVWLAGMSFRCLVCRPW